MIDIEEKDLAEIQRILSEQAPDCEVRAFGSRIEGNAEKYSDLDLVLIGSKKLNWREIESLKDAFAASDLPIIVDVIDWHTLSDEFKAVIEKSCEIIKKGNDKSK
jgi:predicted nucleotidyltransferase